MQAGTWQGTSPLGAASLEKLYRTVVANPTALTAIEREYDHEAGSVIAGCGGRLHLHRPKATNEMQKGLFIARAVGPPEPST